MNDLCEWPQISVRLGDPVAGARVLGHLGTALVRAESAGHITTWFFIRKQQWRFRYLPTGSASAFQVKRILRAHADRLRARGHITGWAETIYEPETDAFGGEAGMRVTHDLFHADSRHLVSHLGDLAGGMSGSGVRSRELSILLCTALLRAAGQDHFEQGDVWAKIVRLRPAHAIAPHDRWVPFKAAVKRLLTVDTAPATVLRAETLRFADDWLTAFEHAGRRLRALAEDGHLGRGLRAVLAHQMIFHWNRLGLPHAVQAAIGAAAKEILLEDSGDDGYATRRLLPSTQTTLVEGAGVETAGSVDRVTLRGDDR